MVLLVFFSSISLASEMLPLIAGKISDADSGESLPFSKVTVKDTNRVITANQDGSFTILNILSGSTIVITKMGYQRQEIQIQPNIERLTINLIKLDKRL